MEQEIVNLRAAAQAVELFYQDMCSRNDPSRDQLPMSFFRALAALTLDRAKSGISPHDVRFTASDLAEKILELGYLQKRPKDMGSDWVRGNWDKLKEMMEARKVRLKELNRSENKSFYPWLGKETSKGGKGNQSYYYLVAKQFLENETIEIIEYPIPENGIRYIQESLVNIPRWARWVNGFTLQSWRRYAYIIPWILTMLATLGYLCLILLLGIYTEISTVKWLTCLIVTFVMFWMITSSPLYAVSEKKVVMAPDWMTPLRETSVILELKKIGINSESGDVIRELRLMVYSAKCPVCENRIEIQSGGLQFPFRLIGRCNESPREHVYSFDHITRTGKPLL